MKNIMLIISIFLFLSGTAYAEGKPLSMAKREGILNLMEMTGALKVGEQMANMAITQMSQLIKVSRPDIPDEMYEVLKDEVQQVVEAEMIKEGGFIEMMLPIYHRHYTHDDIQGLIAFYETDLGKKSIQVLPQLMQESVSAGQMWGQSLVPIIQERLVTRFAKEGYDLKGKAAEGQAGQEKN